MAFPKTFAELKQSGYRFSNHSTCRGCHRDVEWWTTPRDRKMPFDPMEPKDDSPAVPHHATCPNVEQFRGGAR